jgi:hypothetical protein
MVECTRVREESRILASQSQTCAANTSLEDLNSL